MPARSSSQDRAISSVVGVALALALTVVLASGAAVAFAFGVTLPASPPDARIAVTVDATANAVVLEHRGGDALHVDDGDLRVVVTVDDTPLRHQPPVPFFAARGFAPGQPARSTAATTARGPPATPRRSNSPGRTPRFQYPATPSPSPSTPTAHSSRAPAPPQARTRPAARLQYSGRREREPGIVAVDDLRRQLPSPSTRPRRCPLTRRRGRERAS